MPTVKDWARASELETPDPMPKGPFGALDCQRRVPRVKNPRHRRRSFAAGVDVVRERRHRAGPANKRAASPDRSPTAVADVRSITPPGWNLRHLLEWCLSSAVRREWHKATNQPHCIIASTELVLSCSLLYEHKLLSLALFSFPLIRRKTFLQSKNRTCHLMFRHYAEELRR